jgi:predicted ester cyclase
MLHLISPDIKAIARRTLGEIFPRGDVAALAEVIHPNVVDHDGPPGAPPGLDGMAWSLRMLQTAFSDRRWGIHQVIAEDDTVVLSCTFHGRHTGQFMGLAPTSRSFAFRQVHIVRFQDGMGIEHWAVPDDLDLARQLGGIPRPPSQPVLADALAPAAVGLAPVTGRSSWDGRVSEGRQDAGSTQTYPRGAKRRPHRELGKHPRTAPDGPILQLGEDAHEPWLSVNDRCRPVRRARWGHGRQGRRSSKRGGNGHLLGRRARPVPRDHLPRWQTAEARCGGTDGQRVRCRHPGRGDRRSVGCAHDRRS